MRIALISAVCMVVSTHLFAEPLKGEAELGLVATSGNTETENINAKLKLTKVVAKWVHEANFTALSSSSEDQDTGENRTTAEKYTADYKADREIDERSYLYGITTYEDDRFSGFDYQATAGAGYGYKVIAEENRTLALEVGPGYRYNSIEGAEDEDEITLRVAETFDWKFSETAELNQYLNVEGGEDNTISKLGISLKSALTGTLALKVGVDIKYTDEVPADREHTDTETYATISYSF